MNLTRALAERLVGTSHADILDAAKEIACQVCIDGLGVTIAGAREPLGVGRITIDYVKSLGGPPQATVIAGGFSTDVLNAAYANGTMCHALDFDNTWWPLNHPTSPTLPAILALAERDGIPGRDVVSAIVLAFEVQGRLRLASSGIAAGIGFHKPGVSGTMGAVTGAGKLLGLDVDRMCMAFGIAGSRCGSLSANTGTMTKSSHSGHAARMGLEAGLLASRGFTAFHDIFGAGQFFDLFYGHGNHDPKLLVENFGRPYRMVDPGVGFKKYPSNYFTHRPIEAALALRSQHNFAGDDIESVTVDFGRIDYVNRPHPKSGLDAKFSIQYTTGIALLDAKVTIASFSDERRAKGDIVSLLARTTLNVRDDIPTDFNDIWALVRVSLRDGRTLEARCDKPSGLWGVPLTRSERLDKFRMCAEPALSSHDVEEAIRLAENLVDLPSIAPLMAIMRSARGAA